MKTKTTVKHYHNGVQVSQAEHDRYRRESELLQRQRQEADRRDAAIERATGVPPSGSHRSAYGPESEFSYFADMLTVQRSIDLETAIVNAKLGRGAPVAAAGIPGATPLEFMQRGGVELARQRLATVAQERAGDLSSTTPFSASPAPGFILDAFSVAARAAAVVSPLFEVVPLAKYATDGGLGKTVTIPRLSTGATVAVQATENTTASNTDHVSTSVTSLISTLAGYAAASYQLFEMKGAADVVIAADLGSAYASKLDSELLNGTNSAGRTTGLVGLTGATTYAYTDASPSVLELLTAFAHLHRLCIEARGLEPDYAILSARTMELLASDTTAWSCDPAAPRLPTGERILVSANLPTNQGAGTNQSVALLLTSSDLILCTDGVRMMVKQTSPTALELTSLAYGFAASGHKRPEGCGVLSGTGLASA